MVSRKDVFNGRFSGIHVRDGKGIIHGSISFMGDEKDPRFLICTNSEC